MIKSSTWYIGLSLAALVMGASQVQAQTSGVDQAGPSTSADRFDDIVVTARRVEERAQDVPLAITALSGEALKREGVRELRDLSGAAPNLTINSGNTGSGSAAIGIRGQNPTTILQTVDSAVGLYVDDVNISRPYGIRAALIDLERVEVLRGPQGTLFGRNTTGGAVTFTTRNPGRELGGSVELTAGSFDTRALQAVLNIPLSENLRTRITGYISDDDGWAKEIPTGRRLQQSDTRYIRSKTVFESGNFTGSLKLDYAHYEPHGLITRMSGLIPPTAAAPSGGGLAARSTAIELGLVASDAALTALQTSNPAQFGSVMQQAADALRSFIGRPGYWDTYTTPQPTDSGIDKVETYSGALDLKLDVSDQITLRSITGYRKFSNPREVDNDGTPFKISAGFTNDEGRFWSQEVQALGTFGPVKGVIGAYYSDERGQVLEQPVSLVARNGPLPSANDGDVASKSYAFFGQLDWDITDRLSLTAGARWSAEKKSVVSRNRTATGACAIAAAFRDDGVSCVRTASDTYREPTWLASANYKLTDDILVYAKATRGFRGGGQNVRAAGANPRVYDAFGPETLTEYELGFKSDLFDRRLRFNVAAFYDEYKGVQRSVLLITNPVTQTLGQIQTNAASATLKGIEAEAVLAVTDRLTLNASFGTFDAKYNEFQDLSGDRRNERWPAPKTNYSLGARYVQPTSVGDLNANLTWKWQSSYISSPSVTQIDQLLMPPYGLLSGRIALAIDEWDAEISAFGRNLLNKEYHTAMINFESLGYNLIFPGERRAMFVQFTKRFGGE
jgi:iron complex outermembrane receptor protein